MNIFLQLYCRIPLINVILIFCIIYLYTLYTGVSQKVVPNKGMDQIFLKSFKKKNILMAFFN